MPETEQLNRTLIALVDGLQRIEKLVGPGAKTTHDDLRNDLTELRTRFDERYKNDHETRGEREADRTRLVGDVDALRRQMVTIDALAQSTSKAVVAIEMSLAKLVASDEQRKGERGVIAAILRSPLSRGLSRSAAGYGPMPMVH